jgi:hypothetical protein
MERTLLAQLGWDLLMPSVDRFLHSMLAVIGAPHLITSNVLRCNFEVNLMISKCQFWVLLKYTRILMNMSLILGLRLECE